MRRFGLVCRWKASRLQTAFAGNTCLPESATAPQASASYAAVDSAQKHRAGYCMDCGKNVWLTRKGAVRARAGDLGIIPGSMASPAYVVRGLGSEASLTSASHGAGRVMSRAAAKRDEVLAVIRQ